MTNVHRNPAKMLDERSKALRNERKRAFTEGVWMGLATGTVGTCAAWFLIMRGILLNG